MPMLGDKEAVATIAVKDLAAARKFYESTLGLKVLNAQGGEAVTFQSGSTKIIVYRSQYAGTNKATAANFLVGKDIEKIVNGLAERGVPFEHYDMPQMTRTGHIHAIGDFKTAWFKDPDGNIIALMNNG
jgi:catechol 2,3-dioxygenase-like lactoylglutathione lyase family enzyme